MGTTAFKLDRGDEFLPRSREKTVHSGVSEAEHANDYCRQYQETVFQSCTKVHGKDFALLSRAGYTGSSRLTAIWGGDIEATELGLRASIIGAQRAALMGYPYWGSDTGGYGGQLDREVVARWFAFSAFTPIMEVGPLRDRAPWDFPEPLTEPKRGDIAPGVYDRELMALYRVYSKIHEALVPYSALAGAESVRRGTPIVRPMFLEFPAGPESWKAWDQYMYGSEILVAPVWRKGETRRKVYLPPGERWVDAWDSAVLHEGGKTITVDAPLHKIPLFLRHRSRGLLPDLRALLEDSRRRVENPPVMRDLESADGKLGS